MSALTVFINRTNNLTFVNHDREAALANWNALVRGITSDFFASNYRLLMEQKCIAGIVGCRSTNFKRHCFREMMVKHYMGEK